MEAFAPTHRLAEQHIEPVVRVPMLARNMINISPRVRPAPAKISNVHTHNISWKWKASEGNMRKRKINESSSFKSIRIVCVCGRGRGTCEHVTFVISYTVSLSPIALRYVVSLETQVFINLISTQYPHAYRESHVVLMRLFFMTQFFPHSFSRSSFWFFSLLFRHSVDTRCTCVCSAILCVEYDVSLFRLFVFLIFFIFFFDRIHVSYVAQNKTKKKKAPLNSCRRRATNL